jgi:hypothetical protein
MGAVIIDIEGFKISNRFIIKELAFVSMLNGNYDSYIFQHPQDELDNMSAEDMKYIHYCTKSIHGLYWRDGSIPYKPCITLISEVIGKLGAHFFSKGIEKCRV